jgi:hypothetical protein
MDKPKTVHNSEKPGKTDAKKPGESQHKTSEQKKKSIAGDHPNLNRLSDNYL